MNHARIKTTQLFIENDLQYFSIPADDVDIRESFSNSEELSGHLLNGGRYNKNYFAKLQFLEYQMVKVGGQICSMGPGTTRSIFLNEALAGLHLCGSLER